MPAPPALFDSLVDYAGLFPPAKLPMANAVRNHSAYRQGAHATCLGRFVLPVVRLAEFEADYLTLAGPEQTGWQLSVLAGPDPSADLQAINEFNSRDPSARIVSVETRAATPAEVARVTAGFPPNLEVWVEVPVHGEIAPLLAAIRTSNRHAKIRTGGVTPDSFPSAASIAGFLAACRDAQVVCKATAGLHHPLHGEYRFTYEPGSPGGPMFGFLNVFLAAVLVHAGGNPADATALLTEPDARAFAVSPAAINWRHYSFSAAQISATRRSLCRSFGSCSFTEPVEGLQKLHWL